MSATMSELPQDGTPIHWPEELSPEERVIVGKLVDEQVAAARLRRWKSK